MSDKSAVDLTPQQEAVRAERRRNAAKKPSYRPNPRWEAAKMLPGGERKKARGRTTVSCVDRERELLAGEIAALGLDVRCRWYGCKTGAHPAHKVCGKRGAPSG